MCFSRLNVVVYLCAFLERFPREGKSKVFTARSEHLVCFALFYCKHHFNQELILFKCLKIIKLLFECLLEESFWPLYLIHQVTPLLNAGYPRFNCQP